MGNAFSEKSIFIWDIFTIDGGDPAKIAARLIDGGFEAAYIHACDGYAKIHHATAELVRALRAAGLKVYGWGAVYGAIALEAQAAAEQCSLFGLDGWIFDAEGTFDARSNANSNAVQLITQFKAKAPGKPVAWCWWAHYEAPTGTSTYHPAEVMRAAMTVADVGIPMAYWNWGDSPAEMRYFLDSCLAQWRKYTDKPIIPAGRAYVGDGGTPRQVTIAAFVQRAIEQGCPGYSFWSLQHAINLPETWQALKVAPKMGTIVSGGNMYKDFAMGLYTQADNWVNPNFDFIVGLAACAIDDDPNPKLKAIELKAHAEKKPFLARYVWNVDFYTRNQYPMDENRWPTIAQDWPLQLFIQSIQARDCQGVVVEIMDEANKDGRVEMPAWISFAARLFMGRAMDWMRANKPNVPLYLATSNAFISKYAPGMNDWAYKYLSLVDQPVAALDASYPRDSDKPNTISTRTDWSFWRYFPNLVLYCGSRAKLESELHWTYDAPAEPPDSGDDPVEDPAPDTEELELLKSIEAGQAAIAAVVQSLSQQVAEIRGHFK